MCPAWELENHLFSLPNKLFENIQAGTPVICPNYPAFKSIVEKYGNGLLCNPDSMNSINECVEKLRTNRKLYTEIKMQTMKARLELNWEKECTGLRKSYLEIV